MLVIIDEIGELHKLGWLERG